MAIEGPGAIDDALACEPEHSGGWRAGGFLAARGMGVAQGKKVARPPLRHRRSRRSRPSVRSGQQEARGPRTSRQLRRDTYRDPGLQSPATRQHARTPRSGSGRPMFARRREGSDSARHRNWRRLGTLGSAQALKGCARRRIGLLPARPPPTSLSTRSGRPSKPPTGAGQAQCRLSDSARLPGAGRTPPSD